MLVFEESSVYLLIIFVNNFPVCHVAIQPLIPPVTERGGLPGPLCEGSTWPDPASPAPEANMWATHWLQTCKKLTQSLPDCSLLADETICCLQCHDGKMTLSFLTYEGDIGVEIAFSLPGGCLDRGINEGYNRDDMFFPREC